MKNQIGKAAAIIIAVLMLFAACSGGGQNTPAADTANTTAAAGAATTAAAGAATTAAAAATTAAAGAQATTAAPAATTASAAESAPEEAEPYLIRYFPRDGESPDDAMVADAINELQSMKDLGVKIELVKYPSGELLQKMPLLIASNDKMDIMADSHAWGFLTHIEQKALLDITDMLTTVTPDLWDTIPDILWDGMYVQGRIYGVPAYKEFGGQYCIAVEEEFFTDSGFNASDIKKLADIEPYLQLCLENDRITYQTSRNGSSIQNVRGANHDQILADVAYINRNEPDVVVDYFQTDEYKDFVYLMRDWYLKNYIVDDILTRDNWDDYIYDANGDQRTDYYGVSYWSYSPCSELNGSRTYGKYILPLMMSPVAL